ncbi:MAG: histidine kinase [Candidatus Aminicenantes bacterium]|nr:MAG: histidine kinase [Candidatus Aminicenantes bacterium]
MKFLSENNKIRKTLTSRIAYHLYFWAFFLLLFFILPGKEEMNLSTRATYGLRMLGPALFPVYFHFFLFEKYFFRRRYSIYVIILIPALILYVYLVKAFVLFVFNVRIEYISQILFLAFIIFISTSLKVLKRSINERFLLQEIKAKQVQTELNLLKAQINPHFLFNTLNNLFGMARKQDKATADGIAGLSHLMRYMIYESNVDRINLDKETHQIKRLIELQKLRFSKDDEIDIGFKVEGDTKKVQIPPMLLIPFVENAFKHGISIKSPSFIHIHLKAQENGLQFSVRNSIHAGRGERDMNNSGLGLQNVKRRLELLYPDSHELTTHKSANTFEVNLTLKNKGKKRP